MLNPDAAAGAGGFYDFGHGSASPTGSVVYTTNDAVSGSGDVGPTATTKFAAVLNADRANLTEAQRKTLRYDPDVCQSGSLGEGYVSCLAVSLQNADAGQTLLPLVDKSKTGAIIADNTERTGEIQVRRLTRVVKDSADDEMLLLTFIHDNGQVFSDSDNITLTVPLADNLIAGGALGAVVGDDPWGLEEPSPGTGKRGRDANSASNPISTIAEIDIKVDSIAVTAQTKKLKAKWSPELGQDLNAYHNLDAEVELTGILSEQIALEIDRELLGELVDGATAGTRYWSRAPGLFVDANGAELGATSASPDFTGTVSEWYETLIETINDVSAQIHRKTLRGGANFVVCSPEVANILEFTSGFRASVTADQDRGTIGAVKAGSLSKKFDVYVDPYFLRNVILVGRKGSSFLESGFVYAPYVPLQVTPTIFGTEDFVPRKGVMTRYAKKMVRPDMYGLVIVRGLLGEAGAS